MCDMPVYAGDSSGSHARRHLHSTRRSTRRPTSTKTVMTMSISFQTTTATTTKITTTTKVTTTEMMQITQITQITQTTTRQGKRDAPDDHSSAQKQQPVNIRLGAKERDRKDRPPSIKVLGSSTKRGKKFPGCCMVGPQGRAKVDGTLTK